MKRKLVFATNNHHKLNEISHIEGLNVEIVCLKDIGFNEDIPEDFDTLEENALQKARYVHEKTGLDCFADDPGWRSMLWTDAPVCFQPDMPVSLLIQKRILKKYSLSYPVKQAGLPGSGR